VQILVLGAGVIGSVYAGRLLRAGHDVVLLARGARLADLRGHGLVLHNAQSSDRIVLPVRCTDRIEPGDRFDLVLVPARSEQLLDTLPLLTAMTDRSDVLFFGNAGAHHDELVEALGDRVLFGFPAAGGTRDGPVVRYVLISQQRTMLGEPDGTRTPRLGHLQRVLAEAGFPTRISTDIRGWLLAHAAFIVPIALALYRVEVDPARLAADPALLRQMVAATREAFAALRAGGNAEIPANLRLLYAMPRSVVTGYWRRVLASPRGELWFAAHTRAAPEEMHSLARDLHHGLQPMRRPTPALDQLLTPDG
jgi:2-dehydropantoate 2-reductase